MGQEGLFGASALLPLPRGPVTLADPSCRPRSSDPAQLDRGRAAPSLRKLHTRRSPQPLGLSAPIGSRLRQSPAPIPSWAQAEGTAAASTPSAGASIPADDLEGCRALEAGFQLAHGGEVGAPV